MGKIIKKDEECLILYHTFFVFAYNQNKKDKPFSLSFPNAASDSALDLIGTEASCTDVDMTGRTIDDSFHALYVGLPHSVGTSVRVGDLNAERNTLAADIALCQLLHLQS